MKLLPGSLRFFSQMVRRLRLPIAGQELNLDPGFDSKENRRVVRRAGLMPNIKENIRNRDPEKPRKGRPRHWNILSYHSRSTVERTFAWQDTYRALVIRYSQKQEHFLAQNLLAFTLINLRHL
jgi:DDE family transposase